jgi:hypothetical protein
MKGWAASERSQEKRIAMSWIQNMNRCVGPASWGKPKPEQLNINTDGLRVGGKLWIGERGWFVVEKIHPGVVFVRPSREAPNGAAKRPAGSA